MSRHRLEEDTPTAPFPVVAAAAVAIALAAGMVTVDPSPSEPIVETIPERVEQLLIVPPDALDLDLAIAATAAREATESAMPTPVPPSSPAPTPRPTVAPTSTRPPPPAERPPTTGPAASLRERIVANARAYVDRDIPYIYGGKTCTAYAGCDCSALTWRIFQASGLDVPYRTSAALKAWTTPVSRANARPGDLVHYPGHVGIYVGNGYMIDHGGPGSGANLRKVWGSPTYGRIPV